MPQTKEAVHPLTLQLKPLHRADCLFRTHNGQCDCNNGAVIDRAVTITANYFRQQITLFTDRLHTQALTEAQRNTV